MQTYINQVSESRIKQEQTIFALRNFPSGLLAGSLGGWITAVIFSDSWYFTISWNLVYTTFAIIALFYMNGEFGNNNHTDRAEVLHRKHVQIFSIAGILLGVYAYWLIIYGGYEQKMVGLLYAAIVVSLSVAGTSANLKSFLVYIIPIMIGVHIASITLIETSKFLFFVSIGMPLFAAIVIYYGYTTNQSIRSHLILRLLKEDLSAKLTHEVHINQKARSVAENAEHAKTRFMAAASHDLRQPLQALHLFLGAMKRDNLDSTQKDALRHVDLALSYMSEMLATLLDYSRIEAGVVTNQPENLALQPLLHSLLQTLGPLADQKDLVIRQRDTTINVFADKLLLERILRNLISNALRYTENGGILLSARIRGDQVMIEVWDTGIGMPEDKLSIIFQEFVQLNNQERDGQKGLGLGLAIVLSICKLINARIEVRSRIHRGSVFRVWLPMGSNEKIIHTPLFSSSEAINLSGLSLLVVDDNDEVVNSIKTFVSVWGCQCFTADTGEKAELILRENDIDFLITDYRLRDDETGGHVIERLQHIKPNLKSIIITGDTDPKRLREAYQLGAQILSKPVSATELLHHLLRLANERDIVNY